ncbi:MAG: glycosyltransferase, partial [Candidatus Krumholzibacteria bacterium]|nr:glycosyltransferase [Candidatus Krumholzibacteria bacterium]
MPARRVLMLSYHYTPVINGGVERSARFARYLPEFGCTPVVITTRRYGTGEGRLGERVIRTGEMHNIPFLKRTGAQGDSKRAMQRPQVEARETAGRRSPLVEWVLKWLMIPDDKIRWASCAFPPALRLLRRGEADVIYSTSPPESSHLLGMVLKGLTGKPWIMDLRDPWTFEPLKRYIREPGLRLSIEKRLEKACFKHSDIVIANTQEAGERYRTLYPKYAGKVRVITNGFDGDEMAAAASAFSHEGPFRGIGDDVFLVSHVGTFSRYTYEGAYP